MEDSKIFIPVPGLKRKDLLDWKDAEQRNHRHVVYRNQQNELRLVPESDIGAHRVHRKCFGNRVALNDEQVALFRYGDEVYAMQAQCPHAGGPLYLADLEDLVPEQICVKCPWHKWTFNINSGLCVTPRDREVSAKIYPVKVNGDGQIYIGFDSLGPSAFQLDF